MYSDYNGTCQSSCNIFQYQNSKDRLVLSFIFDQKNSTDIYLLAFNHYIYIRDNEPVCKYYVLSFVNCTNKFFYVLFVIHFIKKKVYLLFLMFFFYFTVSESLLPVVFVTEFRVYRILGCSEETYNESVLSQFYYWNKAFKKDREVCEDLPHLSH